MTEMDETRPAEMSPVKRILSIIGGGILGVFALGVAVGYTKAALAHGVLGWKAVLVYLIAGIILLAGLWLMRKALAGNRLASTPRMREYQIVMIAMLLLGGVLGALLQFGAIGKSEGGLSALTSNAPVSPVIAAVLLATFPLLGWLCYRWHRTADEHEQAAYNFGGILALYAYFFISTGWWMAWRGALLPEPSGIAIFWLVMVVWTAGWGWRRYR